MQISYKGDYALKALLQLALRYGEGVVTIHELAKGADMPLKFLEQVLLELKKGGFVDSKRGIHGGYFLTRKPVEIRLGEVVRFIDGPIEPISCATDPHYKGCKDTYSCVFKDIWKDVGAAISGIVDNVTFQDLAEKLKQRLTRQTITYNI
ncbi:MAG: Rrf2 family transcriptional regulator [Candidatus Omnitrophica bacterium]|nr:Rrf2 family transcriptional regulator [Candidatus Omnitrophota bacterium]